MSHFKLIIFGKILVNSHFMTDYSESLIKSLSIKVKEYPRFSFEEIEKFCWMAVHEHKHGVLPSEYDIREIDEELYLQLLKVFKTNSF